MAEILTIPAIIALLNAPLIAGLSAKEIGLSSIQASFCIGMFYQKAKITAKLSALLFFCLFNDFPSKKERSDFYKLVSNIFNKHNKTELYVIYKFYKKLKNVMRLVSFDDVYFKKNKELLIEKPELMKAYAIKKLYIQRLHHLIIVKLYNNTPEDKNIIALKDNLTKLLMNVDIDFHDVEDFVIQFEQDINNQYLNNKVAYDKDFESEKNILKNIVEVLKDKQIDVVLKGSLFTIMSVINEEKNIIAPPEKISQALSNSMNEIYKLENATKKEPTLLDKLRSK